MAAKHAVLWIQDDDGQRWGPVGGETRTQYVVWESVGLDGVDEDELNNDYLGPDGVMVTIGIGPARQRTVPGVSFEDRPILDALWEDLFVPCIRKDSVASSPREQDDSFAAFEAEVHEAIDQLAPSRADQWAYVNGLCITGNPRRALAAVESYGLDPLHVWRGRAGLDAAKFLRDLAIDLGWDGRPAAGGHRWLEHRLSRSCGGAVVFMDLDLVTPGTDEHKDLPIQLLSLLKHIAPFAIFLEAHPQRVIFRGRFGQELAHHVIRLPQQR